MNSQQIRKSQKLNILGSRILVVNDWSPGAVGAIAVALQFVKATGADLVVLNVNGTQILPRVGPAYSDLTILNIHPNGTPPHMRSLLEEHLVPAVKAECPAVKVLSVDGDPASEIVKAAFDADAALIILAGGGDRKEGHLPSNDTAGKVMKFAACSVLIVKDTSDELNLPPVDIRRVNRVSPAVRECIKEAACEHCEMLNEVVI